MLLSTPPQGRGIDWFWLILEASRLEDAPGGTPGGTPPSFPSFPVVSYTILHPVDTHY